MTMHAFYGQQHPNAIYSREPSQELQRKLYLSAKKSRNRRFHALYDRIHRPDILWRAWLEVKKNGGASGLDNLTFDAIEKSGVENFLHSIQVDLQGRSYRAKPVLRVKIPKSGGGERPLGIPTIRDRVVQQACKIVIEPIFEANFQESSFGFRPKRSAQDAVAEVRHSLVCNWWVVDADIKGYFDSIDHNILLHFLRRRISDRRVLKLLRQWLTAGVVEKGTYHPTNVGSPQGGVISPLLANIYLHVFDMHWNTQHQKLGKLVRYADDFVIICQYHHQARKAYRVVEKFMARLKLRLHPEKTRVIGMANSGFDFLGFYFRKIRFKSTGKLLPYTWPSQRAMKAINTKLKKLTSRDQFWMPMDLLVANLNRVIKGWRNYFSIGNSTKKFKQLDYYVRFRLLHFMRRRGGNKGRCTVAEFFEWYRDSQLEPFYKPGVIVYRL